jgi:hypothetical protein
MAAQGYTTALALLAGLPVAAAALALHRGPLVAQGKLK